MNLNLKFLKMITVNDLIENLILLKNDGYGNLPIIYSEDDEGNNFHKVINLPSLYLVENINDYYLEPDEMEDDDGNEINFIPNCVIIN